MLPSVHVFNNLRRNKEELKPITPGEIKFYSCGPTTYDFLHVGNARALVVGDLIHRIFKALGYKVTFVRNFTDVDDKIIDRANELKVDPLVHSQKYVDECLQDMNSLNMLPATHTPKVSDTMSEIVSMIEDLIKNGYGYVVDGEVLYHVPKFKDYGKLSKKDLDSLQHGIRVEVDQHKKHPADFVLWKPAKAGEPAWDSPWGKGRPGWHIECSAMSKKFLGKTFDIHHGGIDLMFPHHENEIAQSEAANSCEFVHSWVHNEFLNFGSEKMSKSLGNVITIRKFVETYGGKILRQLLASVHYRSKLDWSEEVIERAISDVERIHEFMFKFQKNGVGSKSVDTKEIDQVLAKMKEELCNDFNMPGALSHFFATIRFYNREFSDTAPNKEIHEKLKEIIDFTALATGLIHQNVEEALAEAKKARGTLSGKGGDDQSAVIEGLIAERKSARASKDWAKADQVRDRLNELGVVVKDNPDGTVTWSYK
ncbi:MAG: cysteine--tRNA ligase [Bacteriovoracaceae bacterium]